MFTIQMSPAVHKNFPALQADLRWIHAEAKELDPDIPDDFIVHIRMGRRADNWTGHAYGDRATIRRGKRIEHPNGRITMSVGIDNVYSDFVRLFSHELRHLAQFERGREQFGRLTLDHMGPREFEPDCLIFEGRVMAAMMLDSNDYPWRNKGRATEPKVLV